jgi:hypothetical protein
MDNGETHSPVETLSYILGRLTGTQNVQVLGEIAQACDAAEMNGYPLPEWLEDWLDDDKARAATIMREVLK